MSKINEKKQQDKMTKNEKEQKCNTEQKNFKLIFTTSDVFEGSKEHSRVISIKEDLPDKKRSRETTVVLVELGKFNKKMEELCGLKDYWLYFLKRGGILTKEEKIFLSKKKEMKMAIEHLEEISQDEELRKLALWREKFLSADKVDNEDLLTKGEKELLFKMLDKNFDLPFIMQVTELSEEEIKKIAEKR